MRGTSCFGVLTVLASLSTPAVFADDGVTGVADPLAALVGQRIRVGSGVRPHPHIAGSGARPAQVGVLESYDSETLTLSVKGRRSPIKVPRNEVRRLEVARGRGSIAGATAVFGALAGLAAGYLAMLGVDDDLTGSDVAGTVLLSGAAGAGLGAVIGAPVKVDKWERVSAVPSRAGVRLQAVPGGVAFSVSFPFHRRTPRRSSTGAAAR